MLPITACSSTGQFCHDGSCGWQRRMRAAGPALERDQHRAAPALDAAEALPERRRRRGSGARSSPCGQRVERSRARGAAIRAISSKRTATRAATSPSRAASPCARRARRRARPGSRTRRSRAWPLARPARPVRPSCARERGRDAAAGAEAVLQPGVLVVDVAQRARPRARASRTRRAIAPRAVGREVARDAARHDDVHQQRWPKSARVGAQHVLLQARELREAEGEAAVVAEVAEVAQVVGDALALEQRARAATARAAAASTPAIASSACAYAHA